MTVEELRAQLDTFPDHWEVCVAVPDGGYEFEPIASLSEEAVYGPRNIVAVFT